MKLLIIKYCKLTGEKLAEKTILESEWKDFKKYTKDFYYRAYQIK